MCLMLLETDTEYNGKYTKESVLWQI